MPGTTTPFKSFTTGTPYQLMTYGGTLSGSFNTLSVNPADVPAGDTYSFSDPAGAVM